MCVCFFILLLLPVAAFNREENVVSKIDNRTLTNNPFGENYETDGTVDITDGIENYIEDRIGFRDDMIYGYTRLHDTVFHQMVHPTYMYGKDGYIMRQAGENIEYGEFHTAFADMVGQIQDYCDERGTPFLFVYEPSKTAVLWDELADGIHFNDDWLDEFEAALDKRNVNHINNTDLLRAKSEAGEQVFNKQYDAGHWNDLGAFYGVNHILETMKKAAPGVHINSMDEFTIEDVVQTSLPVSEFPIEEHTPYFDEPVTVEKKTELYENELKLDEANHFFEYTVNEERKAEGSPKTLVMQGSYMNEMGGKFFQNSMGEYIGIHSYQNVMDFDYYYNIFKPDYVVFEVTEYVFANEYFSYEKMKNMKLAPTLESFSTLGVIQKDISELLLTESEGEQLTVLRVEDIPASWDYAYLTMDGETYEFQKKHKGKQYWFEITIDKTNYDAESSIVNVVDSSEKSVFQYHQ